MVGMESNEHEEAASRSLLGKLKLPTPGTDLVGLAQVGLFVIVLFYVLHG